MDGNNWRQTQGGGGVEPQQPQMDPNDWRTQLQADSRQRIVNKIMETLKRHLPFSGNEGLQELKKIAVRFEEKIYTAATSQSDYLRKISLKMLTMETKSQNTMPNTLPSNSASNSKNPIDPGSQGMQSQINNQGQPLPVPIPTNQSQAGQQMISQGIHNNIASSGVQGSASLTSAMPPGSSLSQATMPNIVGQNSSLQPIQNISGISQNSVGNTMVQGVASNSYVNQRQMQGRQQLAPQQQQQQSQNSQHYITQQQLQQQLMKQKLQQQQGNIPPSVMQSHMQQQHQQQQQQQQPNLLQPNQLQNSQQSVMQPTLMQPSPLSNIQPNQQSAVQQSTQPMIQQHAQSAVRQQRQQQLAPSVNQQMQQQILPTQQQQQQQQQQQNLMGQQQNAAAMQQNQLIGQQNNLSSMQNNVSNLQQHQLMGQQQNSVSSMHQQPMGPQIQQQQQQQLLGTRSGNSSMLTNQHPVQMLQSKVQAQQQNQPGSASMLSNQGQPGQAQLQQQQMMSQLQSQSGQIPQQLGLQQQPNLLQRDMQQRLQTSAGLHLQQQQQNVIDQNKQMFQPQRAMPEASSTSLDSTAQTGTSNGGDWQEEVYQKIKTMKELYLQELSEFYQKISGKLQLHEALPQQSKSEQLDKLKIFKNMLERLIAFLQLSKDNIVPSYKEKLSSYEKQIVNVLNSNRPRKPVGTFQQGQTLPPTHLQSMQTQSQLSQVPQSHDMQVNPQLQNNLQGPMATMQQSNIASMQHNSMSPLSGVSSAQQNMLNSLQSNPNLDPGQNNGSMNSLQQVAVGSLQQNPVNGPQQVNMNPLSTQGGLGTLQSNINPLQSNANMLQHQQLKQQQFNQRQMQQQFMQKQQLLQQQQQQQFQQTKQQHPAQLQANQLTQIQQMNDGNDMKMRQQMGVKTGAFQQHHSAGQRAAAYHHQQLKSSGASFPISSPQLLSASSPQIGQHPSPQIDQQNLLNSLTKAGTPLQSANSPFIVPSPSTPLAPSPMPGESEKVHSGILQLSNVGSTSHQHLNSTVVPAQSLAIGTPGISASPLLAEFTSPDVKDGNAATAASGKSTATEQPLERLLRVVKSMSPKALSSAVNDIGSVVSMMDRIAGSAPGNGSRAAVGEDLVAMTKCRLQARNFVSQEGASGMRKMKRFTSAMPMNVVSSAGSMNDSFKQLTGSEGAELESTATSVKRPRTEANHVLLEEIREINQKLIDTVLNISEEDVDLSAENAAPDGGEGTVVKCSFSAVALGPNLKAQYASAQMSPIQPLRLLVPSNYPNCSPVLLDKIPVEVGKEIEDLSVKAKSRFSICLRSLSQPMSLGEIARTWDNCTRAVILEFAQKSGGGSFSSKYGTWENCLTA